MNDYTVAERYGNACETSDLSLRNERTGSADVLLAAGMVGVKHGLSLSVWRWLYGGDKNEQHEVILGLTRWLCKRLPQANKNRSEIMGLVILVTDWYEHKACKVCKGTKFKTIKDTGRLSNKICPACQGTGERSISQLLGQHGSQWISPGLDLRDYLDHLCQEASGGMYRKLRK